METEKNNSEYSVQELLEQLKQDSSWEEDPELREMVVDSLSFCFNV